ncbi:MAG: hypothetical protein H6R19_1705, partial [Proteobacteria bacterium]|nr:hypothetical protein [Pseudomonadota bacterium]
MLRDVDVAPTVLASSGLCQGDGYFAAPDSGISSESFKSFAADSRSYKFECFATWTSLLQCWPHSGLYQGDGYFAAAPDSGISRESFKSFAADSRSYKFKYFATWTPLPQYWPHSG